MPKAAAACPSWWRLNKIDLRPTSTPRPTSTRFLASCHSRGSILPRWGGGDTEVVKTSAATGPGHSRLAGHPRQTIAELHGELKADPDPAGHRNLHSKRRCPKEQEDVLASMLVQEGTLRVGDVIVCGDGFGRVRALHDDPRTVDRPGRPSTPVEVSGSRQRCPTAGETFASSSTTSRVPVRSPRPAASEPGTSLTADR